jgi:hypothetical protein
MSRGTNRMAVDILIYIRFWSRTAPIVALDRVVIGGGIKRPAVPSAGPQKEEKRRLPGPFSLARPAGSRFDFRPVIALDHLGNFILTYSAS